MHPFILALVAASVALATATTAPKTADPHLRHFEIKVDSLQTASPLATYPVCLTDATELSLHFGITRGVVDVLDMHGRWAGSARVNTPVTVSGECVYIQVTHGSFVLDGVTARFESAQGLHPWRGEDASGDVSIEPLQTEVVLEIGSLRPGQSVVLTDTRGQQQHFTEAGQYTSNRFASGTMEMSCQVAGVDQPDADCDAQIVTEQDFGVVMLANDDRVRCQVFGAAYSCLHP